MKHQSTSGASVQSGISSQDGFHNETPKSLGMDNKGKDSKPIPTPKRSVGKGGKSFEVC